MPSGNKKKSLFRWLEALTKSLASSSVAQTYLEANLVVVNFLNLIKSFEAKAVCGETFKSFCEILKFLVLGKCL